MVCDKTLNPITGFRYTKVGSVPSYDLCQAEYDKLSTAEQSQFQRLPPPVTPRRVAIAVGFATLVVLASGQRLQQQPPSSLISPREDSEDFLELPPLSPAEELVALFFRPKIPATQRERARWEY